MNQDMLSLFTDCLGLKQRRIPVAINPKTIPKTAETIRLANCRPPCFPGLSQRAGVLEFLPAAKMESNMPPRVAKMMP